MSLSINMIRYMAARAFVTFAFALALIFPAQAYETILAYTSNVTLLFDGSVEVTEIIEVRAEGINIRRGIFRDIPTELINDDGSRLRSNLEVTGVEKNGEPEPWFIRGITGGTRIYVGDADIFLPDDIYTYTIHYTMTRMARGFEGHDELFWNATGNYWDFPIEKAVANITLPKGAIIGEISAYTGAFGSTESAVEITRTGDNTVTFRATRPLAEYEGMSVAASFQKGVLTEPELVDSVRYYLSDHRNVFIPGIAVFVVLLYNLFAWSAVGRDPKRSTIIPLFYPPKDYSPALVHYIWAWGWKKNGWQAFTAAMVNLGVKGLIEISKPRKNTKMEVTGKQADNLPPGEQIIFNYLRSRSAVSIDKKTGPALDSKRLEFITALQSENRQTYFKKNYGYVAAGIALSVACVVMMLIADVLDPIWLFIAIVSGAVLGLLIGAVHQFWLGSGIGRFLMLFWIGIIGFNVTGGVLAMAFTVDVDTAAIAAISIMIINVVFAILMRAPTVQGRKLMDQIYGFRMYLETAEKERLNFISEPEMTTSRFEAILPYAIALSVEKPWSERFESELSRNAVPDARKGYDPVWYHGAKLGSSSITRDMSALATGMSAAMIAAQPVSSSSSGSSSSGGSSGGGGGGGGGGGW